MTSTPHPSSTRPTRLLAWLSFLLVTWGLSGCSALFSSGDATPTPIPTLEPPKLDSVGTSPESLSITGPGALAVYRMDVSLDWEGQRAQVAQTVEIVNPGPDFWDRIVFYLPRALQDEDRFILSSVKVEQTTPQTVAPNIAITENGFMTVSLADPIKPNQGAIIRIRYDLEAERTISIARRPLGDVGWNEQIIQFHEWYPRLTPYIPSKGWVYWEPTQAGPPVYAEVADYDLQITVPEEIVVASGGPVGREGNTWKFQLENARSVAFTASPDYIVDTFEQSGVQISLYRLPGTDEQAVTLREVIANTLALYISRFGEYPYKQLVVAQNVYTSNYATGGFISQTGRGIEEYTGSTKELMYVMIPLSMGELYWGQIVGGNVILEPWVMQSLAMYSEYLYDEYYLANQTDWYWESRINYWQPEGALNRTLYAFATSEQYYRNIPRIGATFIHELRLLVGDAAFYSFLRDLNAVGASRIISERDFFAVLQRHTNQPLSGILNEYFDSSIVPPTPLPSITPVPTAGPSPTPTPPIIYVLGKLETLSDVAWRFGVTIRALQEINGLEDDEPVYEGQQLIIPAP
ncbi:MAG TPA: LysM peptidoglycan-binding domain-containing protein [Anaerolineales bacterium]|nr:LysM peptidoglycan-binding domain-containing protein [Anaerolineales bacterium]